MKNFDTATQLAPRVHPLSNAGGAIISDIDLRSPISEEVGEMLRSAWRNYLVLVIRDLNIEEQHQESFCKIFGNLAGLRSKVYRTAGDTKSHALANATTRPETIDPNGPQFLHPIVRTHPETGRKSLFVNRQMTMFIEGLGANESDEILNYLFERIEDPTNVYEHVWKVGDLVLWDNRCTAHARTYYDPKESRILRRMTVLDENPVT